ncbi:hypothetical protein BSNK01_12470 [Bacillaceae bacterium]
MLENPVVSGYGFEPIKDEPEVISECACGCGKEIVAGYEYIEWQGEWFDDTKCLMKFIGAEWKEAGE